MVATGADDRLRGIRERWEASEEQRAAARKAVDQRDLSLVNPPEDLRERRDRLQKRHLRLEGIVDQDDSVWLSFFDCGLRAARSVGRVVEAPRRAPTRWPPRPPLPRPRPRRVTARRRPAVGNRITDAGAARVGRQHTRRRPTRAACRRYGGLAASRRQRSGTEDGKGREPL